MEKISDLTYKVVAISEVPNYNTDECVDWALDMISLGFESPSLLILASLSKPTNYFETVGYLKKSIYEINLEMRTGDSAVLSYASYFIKKISQSLNIKENLKQVYEFCKSRDYELLVYDFYLLYWAWDDIDFGNDYTAYWEGAEKENIEDIVMKTAIKWIADNQVHYVQRGSGDMGALE